MESLGLQSWMAGQRLLEFLPFHSFVMPCWYLVCWFQPWKKRSEWKGLGVPVEPSTGSLAILQLDRR